MELIDRVREALNAIVDPCSVAAGAPAGLVDLGLVRRLDVSSTPAGTRVRVSIGVTEPGCMMGASFAIKAQELLATLPEVAVAEVALDHAADWTPEDIAPSYRLRLAEVRSTRRTELGLPRFGEY